MTEIREFDLNILNSGLSPYELSEKERLYFPEVGDSNKFIFCEIRNGLLNQWQRNLSKPISINDISSIYCVSKYTELTEKIFTYLTVFSHINHGCLKHTKTPLTNFPSVDLTRKICIVGSGISGLCILNKLLLLGYNNISVLEAEARVGGRIKYTELDGERIDLGASIVNGLTGNPLNVLLKQTTQLSNLHKINPDTAIYSKITKKTIDRQKDAKITELWNKVLDLTKKIYEEEEEFDSNDNNRDKTLAERIIDVLDIHYKDLKLDHEETSLFLWFIANLEYANCTNLKNVSGSKWDQDDAYEFTGIHSFVKSSYSCLTDALYKQKYIRLEREVNCIELLNDKVNITHTDADSSNNEETESFDVAFITVPIGVLKKNYIKFKPGLPDNKINAINNIGAGVMNKVIFHFKTCFWDKPSHGDSFGILNYFNNDAETNESKLEDVNVSWLHKLQKEIQIDKENRGFIHIFWNFQRVVNKPILVALCSGESAKNLHTKTQKDLIEESFLLLKECFENAEKPVKVIVTDWGNDKHFHTSYSYMGKNACSADYEALKEPVGNSIYFAGEHTSRKHPATVSGAYLSGLSATSRFLINPKLNTNVYKLLTTKVQNAGALNSAEQIETLNKENHAFLEAQEDLMISEGVEGRGNLKGIHKPEHTVDSLRMRNILKDLLFDENNDNEVNNKDDSNSIVEDEGQNIVNDDIYIGNKRKYIAEEVRNHIDKLYHKMDKERRIEEGFHKKKIESLNSFLLTKKNKKENKIDKKNIYKSFIKFIYKALEKRKVKNIDVINKITKKVAKEYMKIYLKDNKKFELKYKKNLKLSKFMNKNNIESICKNIDKKLSKYKRSKKNK